MRATRGDPVTASPAWKRMLTGDRPTGPLHLGHYVGSLKMRVDLQDQIECFVLIADLHVLTTRTHDLEEIGHHIRDCVLDYLSVGIDPQKTTIYLQSLVPEVLELFWLFMPLVGVGRARRIPTLKDQMANLGLRTATMALLSYPILQSADILMVKGNVVPVGKDQASHVELTKEIVRRFNQEYPGSVFREPEAVITPVLVGTDGQAKASKSIGNVILLSDSFEEVNKKVRRMFTDPARIRPDVPGKVAGNAVFAYHDHFNPDKEEVADLKSRYRKGKVGDVEVKDKLAFAINRFLDPIRERRAKFDAQKGLVEEIIQAGAARAREECSKTLAEARQSMGLTYFRSAPKPIDPRLAQIGAFVRDLAVDQRTLITMKFDLQRSNEEIATELGLPVLQVMERLRRAIDTLRDRLNDSSADVVEQYLKQVRTLGEIEVSE